MVITVVRWNVPEGFSAFLLFIIFFFLFVTFNTTFYLKQKCVLFILFCLITWIFKKGKTKMLIGKPKKLTQLKDDHSR